MVGPVNQKGANGLIAEYRAALTLAVLLKSHNYLVKTDIADLEKKLGETIKRVANELSVEQVSRAMGQGVAIGEYLCDSLLTSPARIGLELSVEYLRGCTFEVDPVGNKTNSGDPRDLTITAAGFGKSHDLPVSIKAYASDVSSLGSKSGRATLSRLFLGKEKVTDAEFTQVFGHDATEYLETLKMFKNSAKKFYASAEAESFLQEYEARKGHRKVNNKLRRKEVGQFFTKEYGFVSEHKLANLYVKMHNFGASELVGKTVNEESYIDSFKFILGNPQMLVLDAKAGDDGVVREVVNSYVNPAYRKLNSLLRPGLNVVLEAREKSSDIRVELTREGERFQGLVLAMWKDGTIQYKINSSVDVE